MTDHHGEATRPPAKPSTSTNSRSGGFLISALTVATALCLRVIIASAAMMQYSPKNFARKNVSGSVHGSRVQWLDY